MGETRSGTSRPAAVMSLMTIRYPTSLSRDEFPLRAEEFEMDGRTGFIPDTTKSLHCKMSTEHSARQTSTQRPLQGSRDTRPLLLFTSQFPPRDPDIAISLRPRYGFPPAISPRHFHSFPLSSRQPGPANPVKPPLFPTLFLPGAIALFRFPWTFRIPRSTAARFFVLYF